MDSPPERTNLTDLTTDQLLLFDFLFQYRLFERQLRRDVYPLHLNVNYSHGLDDEELSASLKSLEHRGDVTSCETEEGRQWELTPAGGHKWELERNPCWSTYCETRWGESHSGDKVLYSVVSLSERVARNFWEIARMTGYWVPDSPHGRHWTIFRHSMVYWRSFPRYHVITGMGPLVAEDRFKDYRWLEAERCWWRCVSELP